MFYLCTFVKSKFYNFFMPLKPRMQIKLLQSKAEFSSEAIGKRIARIRKKRGLTQNKLATLMGISRSTIANYELGRAHIYDEMIIGFALALKVSTDELLGIIYQDTETSPPLRIMTRVKKIERLPSTKQKAILQTLDMVLDSHDTENNQQN